MRWLSHTYIYTYIHTRTLAMAMAVTFVGCAVTVSNPGTVVEASTAKLSNFRL